MTTRSIVAALVVALTLMAAAPASAQQAKCLAGKTACMAKKAAGLLKCEAVAETPGKSADPNANECVTKARTKFDGGSEPVKGCFEKLEAKDPNDCLRFDDTAAETVVDACVAALVAAIDPPPRDQTKCGAGKKKCASKYLGALLKCRKLAQTPGKPADPNTKGCVDKAVAKYTGGLEPAKGCFAKLEAKNPNDCQSTSTSLTVQGLAENCVAELVAVVAGPASTTTTIATTSTTLTTTTTTIIFGMGKDLCPGRLRCGSSCCGRRQVCRVDAGGNPTCADPPGCGGSGDAICQIPATCILGECLRQCGSTNCRGGVRVPTGPGSFSAVLPFAERCCTTGQSNGLCCDFDTQVCNGAQCRTVICGPDETFVPAIGGCCFNEDVCGSDGNGVGEECCNGTARYFCDPVTVTCKGLAGALCTDGENCFSGSCTSHLCDP